MRGNLLFKITSIIAGVSVSIIFGEIGTRIYLSLKMSSNSIILSANPELVFEHKPNYEFINNYGIIVKYNSMGFIGDEIKDKRGLRILGIGDSITDATYLNEDQRYINLAGKILEQKTGKDVEIINGAVGGYNTWQELTLIKEKGLDIKPDLIIIGICLNDSVQSIPSVHKNWLGRVSENLRDGSKARHLDFLYQRSDLYKFLYDRISKKRMEISDYNEYLRNYNFNISENDWNEWMQPIMEISELGRKNNINVFFAIFPLHNQLVKGEKISYKPLTDLLKERKEYFIDLIDVFTVHYKNGESLYRDFDIIHPTSNGHRIAAEDIADYIINNQMIK